VGCHLRAGMMAAKKWIMIEFGRKVLIFGWVSLVLGFEFFEK
jgi:hypothetical protein